jgi:hypothetical protein
LGKYFLKGPWIVDDIAICGLNPSPKRSIEKIISNETMKTYHPDILEHSCKMLQIYIYIITNSDSLWPFPTWQFPMNIEVCWENHRTNPGGFSITSWMSH